MRRWRSTFPVPAIPPACCSDEYLPQEINDLVEAVAWAAAQDWCDGQVALIGLSWAAFSALRAAAHKPPALKAMALGGVSEDGWLTDIHYLGGALYTGPSRLGRRDADVQCPAARSGACSTVTGAQHGKRGWKPTGRGSLSGYHIPTHDAYWTGQAAPLDGETPLLLYSGLADKYATSVLRIAGAWRGPVRTIIGPWEHAPARPRRARPAHRLPARGHPLVRPSPEGRGQRRADRSAAAPLAWRHLTPRGR